MVTYCREAKETEDYNLEMVKATNTVFTLHGTVSSNGSSITSDANLR